MVSRRSLFAAMCFACCALLAGGDSGWAQNYTPESPEVKELVERGVDFLGRNTGNTTSEAEKALAAYAVIKSQICYAGAIDPNHPLIVEALGAVLAKGTDDTTTGAYAMCVKLLFLSSLDPVAYRPQIDAISAELISRQKANGGWGYEMQQTGDTSMSQMAVLTLWELEHHGVATPDAVWEKVVNWYMRTQDPGGGFGYQGREGTSGALVTQVEVRESLTAGAAGSLYISLDHMNGGSVQALPTRPAADDVPPELREREGEGPAARGEIVINVDRAALQKSMDSVDTWIKDNVKNIPQRYVYYFLYALERYHAFKDRAEGNDDILGGDWYDTGVTYLRNMAGTRNTGWRAEHSAQVDTSFAILFLVRSSKLSIKLGPQNLGGGQQLGRRGDVKSINDPNVQNAGRPRPLRGGADEILKALENPDDRATRDSAVAALTKLSITADDATLSKVAAQLRSATKDPSPEARAAALRALGRTRDLDNVPVLILALRDPEWLVAQQSHESLRFISRRLATAAVELPEGGDELEDVVRDWKEWYLSVRPGAELEE